MPGPDAPALGLLGQPRHAGPGLVAFPLIEGLKSETVCEDDRIQDAGAGRPIGFDEAVPPGAGEGAAPTRSRPAGPTPASRAEDRVGGPVRPGGLPDPRRAAVRVRGPGRPAVRPRPPRGGDVGWYYADFLWKIRGWMDRAIGGVGLRRGRRDPVRVFVGDAIDFWRVEDVIPGRRLLLHAEMSVPGDAWLEFVVRPLDGVALARSSSRRPSSARVRSGAGSTGMPALPDPLVHLPRHGPRHRPGRRAGVGRRTMPSASP